MTEQESMLWSILAEPEEDTVRLAYADWLTENGQEDRAEFIRVQIELHQKGCVIRDSEEAVVWAGEWVGLRDRMMKLLWADNGKGRPNWEDWCWCVAKDEDGRICRNLMGSGGMVVTPHGSPNLRGWPASCAVPSPVTGLVAQEFRRGFISRVELNSNSFFDDYYGVGYREGGLVTSLFRTLPITEVRFKDSYYLYDRVDGKVYWRDYGIFDSNAIPHALCPDDAFDTVEEAEVALSENLVRYSRLAVGLPV